MKTFLRITLILPLCVAFAALVGAIIGGTRFGLPEHCYWHTLRDMLAIAGGLAALFGALLAPEWRLKWRLLLSLGGAVFGAAAGVSVALVLGLHPAPIVLLIAVALWGALLGLWLGWLHGTVLPGAAAGFFLFASIASLGRFLEHPDPGAVVGAATGLVAATLLAHAEQRRRLLLTIRAIATVLFIAAAAGMLLLMPHFWPRTEQYDLTRERAGYGFGPMCFSPDGQRAIAQLSRGIYLWNVTDGTVVNRLLHAGSSSIASAVVRFPSDDKPYCVFIDREGLLVRWNAQTGKLDGGFLGAGPRTVTPEQYWKHPYVLAVSPDVRRAVVVNPLEEPCLHEIDFETRAKRQIALPSKSPVSAISWVDAERLLLGSKKDGSIQVVRLADGRLQVLRSLMTPFAERGRMVVSPDGRHLCVFNSYGSPPHLISLDEGSDSQTDCATSAKTTAAAFSPDSRYLYWVGAHEVVHVWDIAGSREVRSYRQHRTVAGEWLHIQSRFISTLAIRPDGKVAMSTDGTGLVQLWKLDHESQP